LEAAWAKGAPGDETKVRHFSPKQPEFWAAAMQFFMFSYYDIETVWTCKTRLDDVHSCETNDSFKEILKRRHALLATFRWMYALLPKEPNWHSEQFSLAWTDTLQVLEERCIPPRPVPIPDSVAKRKEVASKIFDIRNSFKQSAYRSRRRTGILALLAWPAEASGDPAQDLTKSLVPNQYSFFTTKSKTEFLQAVMECDSSLR